MAVEAQLADELDTFLSETFPPKTITLLSTPVGPEKEALLAPLIRRALGRKEPVYLALSTIPPERLLKGIRVQGTDTVGALKDGRLRVVDWYAHKEKVFAESEEKEGVYRCRATVADLEEALSATLPGAEGKGLAVFEIFADLASAPPEEIERIFERLGPNLPETFETTVLAIDPDFVGPEMMGRLQALADGTLAVHRDTSAEGPVWRAVLRREGEVVRYALETHSNLQEFVPVQAAPSEEPPRLEEAFPGEPCPQCGTLIEGEECTICGFAPEEDTLWQARALYDEVVERLEEDPTDLDALYRKAAALAKMQESREAINVLNELTIHDPRYPGIWMLKAELYDHLGETAKAALCRQRAVSLEGADLGPILDATLPPEGDEFQCPLCQRWLRWDAAVCPCGAEFVDEEG